MRFDKPPTSIPEQIQRLRERGMDVPDDGEAARWLAAAGYYRLSAYWLPFESPASEGQTRSKRFRHGTRFSAVIDRYVFDRKLRLLVFEAIERIEVNARSRWTYHLAHFAGAHAHLDHALFSSGLDHAEQLARLARSSAKSDETFISHYRSKYTVPYLPPLWAATELLSIGALSKWIQITREGAIKTSVARDLGLPNKEVLVGVLQALSYSRNLCAHHSRLWNKKLVKRAPWIRLWDADMVLEDMKGQRHPENTVYNLMVVLLRLIDHQNTDSTFRARLAALLESVGEGERSMMGMPADWRQRPVWISAA